ncbi:hypothetical protein BaRGS_00017081 [Batillaria attramentaria]|uniref:BTB domain-containing protein n=1 Tax=Batillaria attramentaria TaxID=370345 RepID=A0ABD0KXF4_9CAEN
MSWHQKYLETLAEGIKYLWNTGHFADATILVGNKRFRCHRAVLAAMSPHFDATFSRGMRDNPDGVLTLLNIDVTTFDSILNFMYTGRDVVCTENAENLLRAATTLQIKGMITRCEEYLMENLSEKNCITMWKLGRTHNCEELEDRDLDVDELATIIRDDDLVVPNEELVCEAVFRWLAADTENRSMHLANLIEHMRLPLVSPEYLLNISQQRGLQKEDIVCRVMLEEAKRYHMLPARRQEFTSKRASYRNSYDLEEVLVVLTGGSSQAKPTDVICFSFRQNKWFTLAPLPYDPGVEFAACTYANNIYLSGGSRKWGKLFKYNSESNDWRECEQMAQGRSRHGMVAVRDSIYVIGGYNRNLPFACRLTRTVVCDGHVFILTTDGDVIEFSEEVGCRTIGKIENFGRVHFGAVQYRGQVILIGGKRRNDTECDTMLSSDPLRAGAETLPDKMPFPNVIDACVKTVINGYHLHQEFNKARMIKE